MSNIVMGRSIPSQSMLQAASPVHQVAHERIAAHCRSAAVRRGANLLIASVLIGFAVPHLTGGAAIQAVSNAIATTPRTPVAD